MARTLVALAGTLALVSIALVLWFANGADPGPRALVESDAASGTQGTDDTEFTHGATGSVGAAATDSAVARGRRALVGTPEAALDLTGRTFQILCIDRATGAPVPSASVFVSDAPSFDGIDAASLPRPTRTLREHGTPHVADLAGIVEIERPVRRTHIAAWSGEQSGFVSLELPIIDGVATVALDPVRELTVEVRDASGAPVGGILLDVGIRAVDRDGKEYGQPRSISVATSDGSDGELGRVVVDWSAFLAKLGRTSTRVGFVEAEWSSPDAPRITFDPGELPAEPLLLTLAESGRLTVELRDGQGRLVPGRHWISLSGAARRPPSFTAFTDGGRAEYERVALDRTLLVVANRFTFGDGPTVEVVGPTQARRDVAVELVIEETLVVGRAVDEDGRPLADTELLESPRGSGEPLLLSTDSEGRFAFMRRGRVTEALGGREIQFDLVEGSWWSRSPRTAAIDHRIPAEDFGVAGQRSVTDVGDVVFARDALLVQGRIVDAFGRVVPNIGVAVHERAGGGWKQVSIVDGSTSVLGARTSEDGRFAIHAGDALAARAGAGELYLFATSRTFRATEPVSFAPGADVEVVVHSFGRVTGRIAGIDPDDFSSSSVYARSSSTAGPLQDWTEYSRVDRSGGFELDLAPGDWDLGLSLDVEAGERVIDVLERVEVIEGRRAQDPRLDPWEPPIRRIEVSVVDASGAPVDRGTVWMDAAWMEAAWMDGDRSDAASSDTVEATEPRRVGLHYGTFAFYADGPAPDVWIVAEGYESALVRAPFDGLVVTLAPAPTVELAIAGPQLELPGSAELRFVLVPDSVPLSGAPRVEAYSVEGFTDVPAVVELFEVHSPGAWTVLLHVARNAHADSIQVGPSWSIDVAAGSARQRFEIELERAHVDRALEVLRDSSDDD
ncbi:hypothetical protein Pla163_06460 [Planctomycetes bacterium Pla163]|uniref:Nickel uptake substrate-specific transmembrane region n=2 Tax=Rohdeia mirabilis TaxID=2528008 RepID=A0A518CWE4_9BACT|nr:hypothetical protein Pla163_06460 [Planctomycetes bacterium Pla163]